MTYDPRRSRSVSQLKSYTSCGMRYKLERLDKHPSPPAAWTVRGVAVHGVLEDWEKTHRTADPTVLYHMHWARALEQQQNKHPDLDSWIRTPRVKSTERDLELRFQDGLAQVVGNDKIPGYIPQALADAGLWQPYRCEDGSLAVELKIKIDFGPSSDFFVIGYVDLVKEWADGTLTIADFKTGGDSGEDFRQLGTYREGLKQTYGIDAQYGELLYPKLGRSSGWIDLSRYTLDYLRETYSQLDQGIEAGIFLASPDREKCTLFCAVKQFCEEMAGR